MSITNTEKAVKLFTKLSTIEEKIQNYTQERNELVQEISGILGINATPTTASSTSSPKTSSNKKSSLGDRIVAHLQANPGKSIQDLAKSLKVAPNQVGLALFHTTKKGNTFMDNDNYYASVPLTAAAKTAPATHTEEAE